MIFNDNKGIFLLISSQKPMLSVLIRIMGTHNICFYEDLTKISINYHQIRTLSLLL